MNDLCHDCDNERGGEEFYMVRDEIWPVQPDAFLCIGCLEIRLGRRLRANDFVDAPINWAPRPRSERLKARLADGEMPQRWRDGTAVDPASLILDPEQYARLTGLS